MGRSGKAPETRTNRASNVSILWGDLGTSFTPSMSRISGGSTMYRGKVTFSSSRGTELWMGGSGGVAGNGSRGARKAVHPGAQSSNASIASDLPVCECVWLPSFIGVSHYERLEKCGRKCV